MPYFGAGVDQQVSVPANITWIFTPTPSVPSASIRLYNQSQSANVYVGKNPTPATGMPIPPGNRPIEIQNMNVTLYASTDYTKGAVQFTLSAAAVTAGTSTLTGAAAVPTSLASGATFVLGSGVSSGQEICVVASTAANSTITLVNATLFDHTASTQLFAATWTTVPLRVTAGVV